MTNNTVPRQTEDGDSEFTLRLSSDAEMKFRRIAACPAGFLMGSRNRDADEEPAHHVVITEDFWMSETSVTQAQFDVWTKLHQIEHAHHFSGNPNHPAENVTWHQATDFCRWVADTHASRTRARNLSMNRFFQQSQQIRGLTSPARLKSTPLERRGTLQNDSCLAIAGTALRLVRPTPESSIDAAPAHR